MAEQNFYDMTDTAENIDSVIHDLVEVVTEENDGKVLMVEKEVDEETEEVSVNIVEADLPVLEGNENEIVVFDGEDWGKQSSLYAEGKEVSLFDTLPPAFFDSGRKHWDDGVLVQAVYTDDLVVTDLVVSDITGDDEVIIYDMQTDELFSSVGFNSSPLFISGNYSISETCSISTEPNVITLPALESPGSRALGLRTHLFDLGRKYRFDVSVGEGEYELITSFNMGGDYGNKQVIILKTSNTGAITYSTTEINSYHTTLSGNPSNVLTKQTAIVGDRNAKEPADTHFLALSGKARVTAHDNAKLDITHNAQVFMHGSPRFNMDGSSELFMHGSPRFNMDASAELYLHQDSQITSDGEARMHLHDKSWVTVGGCSQVHIQGNKNTNGADGSGAKLMMNGNSEFYMQGDSTGSPKVAINGGSRFYMNGNYQSGLYDPFMAINGKQIFINGNGDRMDGACPTLAIGDSAKLLVDKDSWVKVSDKAQIHMLGDCFTQMTGNAHSEMHNDSFFIMKNRPENSTLERKAKNLYIMETGLLWENLTEEEKLPWYKKADNGHEKVEGSPFFQMVNNSSIDLDDGIDITGDSTGLYLNDEKIATEYSYETEEEGETILNTVNIETLFTELQSALARIAELEETIQTLNP